MKITPPLTWEEALPHPYYHQLSKWGWNPDVEMLSQLEALWPALVFAVFFFFARALCKAYLFNSLARGLGIKSRKKANKFGYQFWLMLAYTGSSLYGFYSLYEHPFFGWPVGEKESHALWMPHPHTADFSMYFYYWWGCGFYFAELFAIFVEPKRSDFTEYVLHHCTTVLLMAISAASYNMRIGVLVLLLHDITDIFLCAAKILHYANKEFFVNIFFVLFMVSFAYLRLYCYPMLLHSVFFHGPTLRAGDIGYWVCAHLLLILQVLHVYWFYLTVRMVARLVTGVKGDVRSDDDDEDEPQPAQKKKVGAGKQQALPKRSSAKKEE